MLTPELLRHVRRLQIRAKRAVTTVVAGQYHSVFKGRGIAFDEVRPYQSGDEVRLIDWNVTARRGEPYVKRFVEERELTVLLAVDTSASLSFGSGSHLKSGVVAELAALIAATATLGGDRVGLLLFTAAVEKFVPPARGTRHMLRILRELLAAQPKHGGTDIAAALDYASRVLRRHSVVFLLSDFLTEGYDRALRSSAKRFDLVPVLVTDPRECELPPVGIVDLEDPETGARCVVDLRSPRLRRRYAAHGAARRDRLHQLFRSLDLDFVEVGTDGRHLDALVRFFHARERRRRR